MLHISPHLGGGVGRFVTNVYGKDDAFSHKFILLEPPENGDFLKSNNIDWVLLSRLEERINKYIDTFDLIQLEFWNHPLLYDYLASNKSIEKARLLIYSHVNGLHSPNIITESLVKLCDTFIASTFASTHSKVISSAGEKVSVVPEFGGCSRTSEVPRKKHQNFNIAYIGSADKIKLHSEYIAICKEVVGLIPNVKFIFCSQDDSSYLQTQAEQEGISSHFLFYKNLLDIGKVLETADVFGYPLNPRHFGTGEQALIEAMGASVPPVVLDNLPERYIVDDGVTGVIATSPLGYIKSMEFLYRNPEISRGMGKNAREQALNEMSEGKTLSRLHGVYRKVLQLEKTDHPFHFGNTQDLLGEDRGLGLFVISQGADGDKFVRALDTNERAGYWKWKIHLDKEHLSPHKGTLAQYLKYFPESEGLNKLVHLVDKQEQDFA
jgi:glycosyltransferase involved in cell wall biosynthesis